MQANLSDKLEHIKKQILVLIKRNEYLEEEIGLLKDKAGHLTNEKVELLNEIKNFQNQEKISNIATTVTGGETQEQKELKQIIGQYIREIDKCIALLSE